jgi:NAD dependent epimerase/dehydratase family enzyme
MVGDMKELVLYGPKTIPSNTLLSGYQFKFEDLDKAIEDLTKK